MDLPARTPPRARTRRPLPTRMQTSRKPSCGSQCTSQMPRLASFAFAPSSEPGSCRGPSTTCRSETGASKRPRSSAQFFATTWTSKPPWPSASSGRCTPSLHFSSARAPMPRRATRTSASRRCAARGRQAQTNSCARVPRTEARLLPSRRPQASTMCCELSGRASSGSATRLASRPRAASARTPGPRDTTTTGASQSIFPTSGTRSSSALAHSSSTLPPSASRPTPRAGAPRRRTRPAGATRLRLSLSKLRWTRPLRSDGRSCRRHSTCRWTASARSRARLGTTRRMRRGSTRTMTWRAG
mmetsp:Transcript_17205/g.49933  ORF Transcript_17205/g.49933 Transcript_17205/m.49933 type:complete len:300 (+) Transcript_17205:3056-3955(+)